MLAGGVGSAVFLMLYMPFTYSGGGGPVGNRYFLGVYPVFLFLVPALATPWPPVVAAALSALFVAPLLNNPFYTSFYPSEHTKTGLFRWLPLELSLVNDLPVNVSPSRSRQPLGGSPPLSAYFMDDNAYTREQDWFWVKGESRADVMLRAPAPMEVTADGERARPLRVPRMEVTLETGPKANHVTIRTAAGDPGGRRARQRSPHGDRGHGPRPALQAVSREPDQLRLRHLRSRTRPASSRSSRPAAATTASSAST